MSDKCLLETGPPMTDPPVRDVDGVDWPQIAFCPRVNGIGSGPDAQPVAEPGERVLYSAVALVTSLADTMPIAPRPSRISRSTISRLVE